MVEHTPELSAILPRLERIEKENRRLKRAGGLAALLVASLLVMGQGHSSRTVEAERFVLKDQQGLVRAALDMEGDRPQLRLNNAAGAMTVLLAETNIGPVLVLTQSGSNAVVSALNGYPAIQVADKEGFVAVVGSTDLLATKTGETHHTSAASLVLLGKDSKVLWSAP